MSKQTNWLNCKYFTEPGLKKNGDEGTRVTIDHVMFHHKTILFLTLKYHKLQLDMLIQDNV